MIKEIEKWIVKIRAKGLHITISDSDKQRIIENHYEKKFFDQLEKELIKFRQETGISKFTLIDIDDPHQLRDLWLKKRRDWVVINLFYCSRIKEIKKRLEELGKLIKRKKEIKAEERIFEAREVLEEASKEPKVSSPQDYSYQQGIELAELGDLDRAIEIFRELFELDSENLLLRYQLILLYLRRLDEKKTYSDWGQALDLKFEKFDTQLNRLVKKARKQRKNIL